MTAGKARRETGYYWIVFPYGEGVPPRWEPAGWDSHAAHWRLIGSHVPWFEFQLQKIGPRINEPDEAPPTESVPTFGRA